jgi:hypothetical protein
LRVFNARAAKAESLCIQKKFPCKNVGLFYMDTRLPAA